MDYDGANQHAVTRLGSISLSPRVSPDGSRIAFSSMTKGGWDILMYSLELNRLVAFPRFGGTNLSPAWSPDGTKLAFSSSRGGDPEIYSVDSSGANLKRLTSFKGARRLAGMESQDGRSARLGERPYWTASGLHHGIRRHQRAAAHRPGIRGFSSMVPQRAISGGFLDAQIWPGSAGSSGHLHHGHRQQAVGAVDPRWRTERLPVLVTGWKTHHFPVEPGRQSADLDHAGRWYESEAVDIRGCQHSTQLELEVMTGIIIRCLQ